MIQCAVMIAGCLLILVLGLVEIGGIGELKETEEEASEGNQPEPESFEGESRKKEKFRPPERE